MSKAPDPDDETTAARPDGEASKDVVYASVTVPEAPLCPTMEMERVRVLDPRHTPTVRKLDPVKGSGPRAPEQKVLHEPKGPAIELPQDRPLTKMQEIVIDRDLLQQWDQEHEKGASGPASKGAGDGEAPALGRAAASAGPRTVGGNTERLVAGVADPRVRAPGSPWAKENTSESVRGSALPSSLGPRGMAEPDGHALESPAGAGRRHVPKGAAILGGAIALVALGVGLRVATTRTTTEQAASTGPAATSHPSSNVTAIAGTTMPEASASAVVTAPTAHVEGPAATASTEVQVAPPNLGGPRDVASTAPAPAPNPPVVSDASNDPYSDPPKKPPQHKLPF